LFDGESGIEKKDTLGGPVFEVAAFRNIGADIAFDLLVDILEGWWLTDAIRYREGKAVGLAGAMVGVLPEDDHFHLIKGA